MKPTPFADFCAAVDDITTTQHALDRAAMSQEGNLEPLRDAAARARIEVKRMYNDALAYPPDGSRLYPRVELDKVVAQIEADIHEAKAKEDSNRAYGLYAQALEQQAHRGGLAAARVRLLALIEGNPS